MAKLTLDDLRKLRDEKKKTMSRRSAEGKRGEVVIGMGTCGIAAGAKAVFDAFIDEMNKAGIEDIVIKQTGCMGLCFSEVFPSLKSQNQLSAFLDRSVKLTVRGAIPLDTFTEKPAIGLGSIRHTQEWLIFSVPFPATTSTVWFPGRAVLFV